MIDKQQIINEYEAGAKQVDLAKKYGCTKQYISLIMISNNIRTNDKSKPMVSCENCGGKRAFYNVYEHENKTLCKSCYNKKVKRWSLKNENCVVCHKNDSPHRSHGKCERCYHRFKYNSDPNFKAMRIRNTMKYYYKRKGVTKK
jgi:hypothetical protein